MYTGSVAFSGSELYNNSAQAPSNQANSNMMSSSHGYPATQPYQNYPPGPVPISGGPQAGGQPRFAVAGEFGARVDQQKIAKEQWPNYQGNPNCIRPAFNVVPANRNCKKKLNIPISISCKPLGPLLDPEGNAIACPVTDIPQGGSIIRCTAPTCRAYMNPFALWYEDGRKWTCPNCHRFNDLNQRSKEYLIGRLDEYNLRTDRYDRPELNQGTMEFVAPQEYTMRPPMRPTFCFMIDVTRTSVQKGIVDMTCAAIKEAIAAMQTDPDQTHERAQVVIVTYDADTHVYQLPNLREDGSWSAPTVLTHPGSCDVYPITSYTNEDIIVEVQSNKDRILRLLEVLPEIWRGQTEHRSGLGTSLKVMELYLSKLGGRVLAFVASRPSVGEVNCTVVPTGPRMKAQSEAMLKPANTRWHQLGMEMCQDKEAHNPVAVELYAFSTSAKNEQSLDLPTLIQLPACTGQSVYQFDATSYDTIDYQRLSSAVKWSTCHSNIAWECCVRVRVSKGWHIPNSVEGWSNYDCQEIRDSLVSYPCLSEDSQIQFSVDLVDDKEKESIPFNDSHLHIQVALLYTTTQGSRRIRLHSLAIPTSQNPADVWQAINPSAAFQALAFQTIFVAKQSYYRAMEYLSQRLELMLQSMRLAQYPYTDTVMRDLATYAFGLTRTDALRELHQNEMSPDMRVLAWYCLMNMMDKDALLSACYPHDVAPEELESYVQRVLNGRQGHAVPSSGYSGGQHRLSAPLGPSVPIIPPTSAVPTTVPPIDQSHYGAPPLGPQTQPQPASGHEYGGARYAQSPAPLLPPPANHQAHPQSLDQPLPQQQQQQQQASYPQQQQQASYPQQQQQASYPQQQQPSYPAQPPQQQQQYRGYQ